MGISTVVIVGGGGHRVILPSKCLQRLPEYQIKRARNTFIKVTYSRSNGIVEPFPYSATVDVLLAGDLRIIGVKIDIQRPKFVTDLPLALFAPLAIAPTRI